MIATGKGCPSRLTRTTPSKSPGPAVVRCARDGVEARDCEGCDPEGGSNRRGPMEPPLRSNLFVIKSRSVSELGLGRVS